MAVQGLTILLCLGAVLDPHSIGTLSYGKTVQSLWLAFFFNGVGVPLATTGLVHPAWAMFAMAASVTRADPITSDSDTGTAPPCRALIP